MTVILSFLKKIRLALTPRDWLLKTTLANGAVVYGRNRAGFGGRFIYVYGETIEPEFQYLDHFLGPTAVFFDVGASTGIYTLKAAQHFGGQAGVVLAIEPFLDVLATLARSVQANGFKNVRLRNFCAGERTGPAQLWRNFERPHSFSLLQRDANAASFSAMMVALDDLFEWEGLDRLDYLKLDVEGAEPQVLAGARRIIETYRPIIQMEVTITDAPAMLNDYAVFQFPGSPNKLFMPLEHPRLSQPERLGWTRLAG